MAQSRIEYLTNTLKMVDNKLKTLESYREWLLDEIAKEDANFYVEYLYLNKQGDNE